MQTQSQECGRGTRRQASSLGQVEGVVEGQQPRSRNSICFFEEEEQEEHRATKSPTKWPPTGHTCFCRHCRKQQWHVGTTSTSGASAHGRAPCRPTGTCQSGNATENILLSPPARPVFCRRLHKPPIHMMSCVEEIHRCWNIVWSHFSHFHFEYNSESSP